jgi:hypothetical protein
MPASSHGGFAYMEMMKAAKGVPEASSCLVQGEKIT